MKKSVTYTLFLRIEKVSSSDENSNENWMNIQMESEKVKRDEVEAPVSSKVVKLIWSRVVKNSFLSFDHNDGNSKKNH